MELPARASWFQLVAGICAVVLAAGGGLRAADCNANGIDDLVDIESGASKDCNANALPDECDLAEEGIAYEARDPLPIGTAHSMLWQDFDGDSDPDLVVPEFFGRGWQEGQARAPAIAYLRNLGLGRFDEAVRYPLDREPHNVFTEDVDADGDPDLLLIAGEPSSVGVFRNRGDGTFAEPEYFPVGSRPRPWVREITADLDGDGDLDIVTSNMESQDISILRNRGDGSFEPQVSIPVPRAFYYIFADVDSDGDVDIILDTYNTEQITDPGSIVVLKNDGHGAFPDRDVYLLGTYLQELSAADLDLDGDLDIVVAQSRPRTLAVLRNRGDGRFSFAPELDPGHVPGRSQPEKVNIADVDGDGDPDVLAAADGILGTREVITLFLNDGRAGFAAGVPLLAGDEPDQIEVLDLDGDTRPEVVALNSSSRDLTVLRNLGGGSFAEGVQFPLAESGGSSMGVADLDADGDLDVASVGWNHESSVVILENISGGSFTRGCNAFVRGDVNSDGELSIADIIMLRRYLFEGSVYPTCLDAADTTDNDVVSLCDAITILFTLFQNPGWASMLPAPSPDPGEDPTPMAPSAISCDLSTNFTATRPLGCLDYLPAAPLETDDILRLGDVQAVPGQIAKIPVHLTASVPVDAIQIVLAYDPAVLEPVPLEEGITFEGTFMESFAHPFGVLSAQPEHGVLVGGIAGDLILPGSEVPPGDDVLVGWINIRVRPDAPLGELSLDPTNGPGNGGVGPYRLRNEITHKGGARFVSVIPRTIAGRLGIVGDQSLFIRGDTNGDEKIDISDPVSSLRALFLGLEQPPCRDADDSNDDGMRDITDAVFTLDYLFRGSIRPPAPFPGLGTDPTEDSLGCSS